MIREEDKGREGWEETGKRRIGERLGKEGDSWMTREEEKGTNEGDRGGRESGREREGE